MTISNAVHDLLDNASRIQAQLAADALNMELAIEQRQRALQIHKEAKSVYDSAEAEFLADLMFGDESFAKARNAEQREVLKDRALVAARATGNLAAAWYALLDAERTLNNATLAFDQCDARFKAVRCAVQLQAAMLTAYASDSGMAHG